MRPASFPSEGVVIGQIVAITSMDIMLSLPLLGDAAVPAQSLCPVTIDDVGRSCAVFFIEGDRTRPLIMGFLLDTPSLEHKTEQPPQEVRVDGKRIVVCAQRELELRCGESAVVLRRDGTIQIRGNYITSHATATQRIRGGSVHVN